MREIVFLNTNKERWKQFEGILQKPKEALPDTVADLFVQLTDDLAFARTYYPDSQTTRYLNSLALKTHQLIYRNRKERSGRIKMFWLMEFPLEFRQARKHFWLAFTVFMVAVLIGIVSTANDDSFVRLILGDRYVNMTIRNIESGDPMAVYKGEDQTSMFLYISLNNIRVAFYAFVMGVFLSYGTGYILFFNGIMLGAFQYFFYQYDLLYESVLTIWIHGTLEIFVIIVAGGAGITMGNSILFPGTLSRKDSFKQGVARGVKIVVGLVPIFATAAFLEGFVTRYTDAPDVLRMGIILASLTFIVWYFFIYPEKVYKMVMQPPVKEEVSS